MYSVGMKRYVEGFIALLMEEGHDKNWQDYDVGYAEAPTWILPKHKAEVECARLATWKVHVGEHFCSFAIEELNSSEFTVVCVNHPEHLKVAAGRVKETPMAN